MDSRPDSRTCQEDEKDHVLHSHGGFIEQRKAEAGQAVDAAGEVAVGRSAHLVIRTKESCHTKLGRQLPLTGEARNQERHAIGPLRYAALKVVPLLLPLPGTQPLRAVHINVETADGMPRPAEGHTPERSRPVRQLHAVLDRGVGAVKPQDDLPRRPIREEVEVLGLGKHPAPSFVRPVPPPYFFLEAVPPSSATASQPPPQQCNRFGQSGTPLAPHKEIVPQITPTTVCLSRYWVKAGMFGFCLACEQGQAQHPSQSQPR